MIRALLFLQICTQSAAAQGWQTITDDDGSFYVGLAYVSGKIGLFLVGLGACQMIWRWDGTRLAYFAQ